MSTFLAITAAILLVIVVVGLWLVATANRLNRLHIRTDAAWAALDAALARRAVVARAIAGSFTPPTSGNELKNAAATAEQSSRADREMAENELTHLLNNLDRKFLAQPLSEELLDAEHRVVIARRMHNDAVRDVLALRRRRKVRYFKLAGKAPRPEYFEIAEPTLT